MIRIHAYAVHEVKMTPYDIWSKVKVKVEILDLLQFMYSVTCLNRIPLGPEFSAVLDRDQCYKGGISNMLTWWDRNRHLL